MEQVRQMQRIKELRKEKSMNQIALGMELNFSQKIISEYENGKVEPSITTLKKLASIFNTSVDYIIEYTNIRQPIDKIAQSKLSETECELLNEFRCLPKEKQNIAKGKIDRVQFTEKLVGLHKKGQIDEESWDKIINSAMQLPQTGNTAQKTFTQVQGRSSLGVFNTLLFESGQTIEHVHPHSRGGKNDTDNYLAECGECNHKRGNVSYLTWLKVHPEYPVNVQKHIEWFQQQVVDGNIGKEYDDYGTKIKQTLSKESNGIMELKVLDKEKIEELRERAQNGEKVSVSEEIKKQEEEQAA